MGTARQTALYACHQKAGARFVDFGGWDMPVQYTGTLVEHAAVRNEGGIFDVSHMGEVVVRGSEAIEALNRLITNDLNRIGDGRAQYTVLCKPDGGIVDDLIIYRVSETELFLCVNASNREKDFNWIQKHLTGNAEATDESDEWSQIALQGPIASGLLAQVIGDPALAEMRPFRFVDRQWNGHMLRIATTGYTGSGGFEIYLPNTAAPALWEALLEAGSPLGLIPAGLGARDTLRLEKGYCLYGNDIDETTSPLEAGLQWVVRLEKDQFMGADALRAQKESGIHRKLVGFMLEGRGIARAHCPIFVGEEKIGTVTSGNMSPMLKKAIGMAYVSVEHSAPGSQIEVEIRGRKVAAVVQTLPFL